MLLRLPNRFLIAALAVSCCMDLSAAGKKHAPKQTPWQLAESARETLMQMQPETRKRDDYTVVMDAYRVIYHENTGDQKAPDAIFAVAGLLADEGRVLHDQKALHNAIGQYEFLRTQYPRASLRIPALYQEALIAQNDLGDTKLAREKYALYVKTYPKSDQASNANEALAALKSGRTTAPAVPVVAPVVIAKNDVREQPVMTAAEPGEETLKRGPVKTGSTQSGIPAAMPTAMQAGIAAVAVADAPVPGPQHVAPLHKGKLAVVSGIRHWSTPTYTRVVIDLGDDTEYEAARVPRPDRIYFDLHGTRLAQELIGKSFAVTDDGFLKKIRAAQFSNDVTRVVLDVNDVTEYSAFLLPNPYRLIIDIHGGPKTGAAPPPTETAKLTPEDRSLLQERIMGAGGGGAEKSVPPVPTVPSTVATHSQTTHDVAALSQQPGSRMATTAPTSQPIAEVVVPKPVEVRRARTKPVVPLQPTHVAEPTSDGQRSLVRALGLKIGRIVIDAGHGGHDSGTLGVDGIMEKDVVLDVALRLGKMLNDRLGAEIIYTRSDDTFIPLETRTAIANKAQADLFISIHANSSSEPAARGVEVYYLNFTSQPDALDVAARENAVSDQSIHQLADLVKKITLKDKIDESREFAADVDQSLFAGLQAGNAGLKNRGVKKAPFVVLIGANMPSILAEISFVTNPRDAAQLKMPEYRQRVAESLYKGVARYASGLSGMRVAQSSRAENGGGQ